jgi:oligopeptide/dipeptide ABC transporter ATP-binding protein
MQFVNRTALISQACNNSAVLCQQFIRVIPRDKVKMSSKLFKEGLAGRILLRFLPGQYHVYFESEHISRCSRVSAEITGIQGNEGIRLAAPVLGDVPSPSDPPSGCRFHTRCPLVMDRCRQEPPGVYEVGEGSSRCFLAEGSATS